jgi:acetyl-CoA carboxylase biotin carboxyl carrier protein
LISDRAALAAAAAINTAMPWQKALTLHPRNWTPREAYATRADPCLNGLAGDGCDSGGKPLTRIPIDPDTIRALAAVLVETGLTEIEIADKDSRIRVVRGGGTATTVVPVAAAPQSAPVAAPVAQDAAAHPGAVISPMVGVAYLSPEPGAPAFVNVGQPVTAGQTLMLIEAMKTFNQIKAPKAGTVSAILVQSGAPVEYGEVLIILE